MRVTFLYTHCLSAGMGADLKVVAGRNSFAANSSSTHCSLKFHTDHSFGFVNALVSFSSETADQYNMPFFSKVFLAGN